MIIFARLFVDRDSLHFGCLQTFFSFVDCITSVSFFYARFVYSLYVSVHINGIVSILLPFGYVCARIRSPQPAHIPEKGK